LSRSAAARRAPTGEIAGSYAGGGANNGFLDSGSFTTLNVPGASLTALAGINNSGQIVGLSETGSAGTAFLYNGSSFTTLAVGANYTFASGISNSVEIVGGYFDTQWHGYSKTGSTYTAIDVPGAGGTMAIGVNNSGQILAVVFF
jgi:probable HAF family extracellular repeat protein